MQISKIRANHHYYPVQFDSPRTSCTIYNTYSHSKSDGNVQTMQETAYPIEKYPKNLSQNPNLENTGQIPLLPR